MLALPRITCSILFFSLSIFSLLLGYAGTSTRTRSQREGTYNESQTFYFPSMYEY